ncbi:putative amino acid transporter, transmembrane domain-containing protein [Rosa chinensis]|uniref:Putative amino acid transporter, transmembrane domain-containing protein n=1 Tax=Rosa chinensis TaxID=74649 RepID=A0A2P6RCZ5_ROSCH|nr:putative amino acid transporter, transmembrane domain-containing protein [Rosa chinensis]
MVVMVLAVLASCMPAFGMFTSLVGSTVCTLISFVLPATFHLTLFGSSLQFWQKTLDFSLFYCVDYFLRYMVLTMP